MANLNMALVWIQQGLKVRRPNWKKHRYIWLDVDTIRDQENLMYQPQYCSLIDDKWELFESGEF